MKKFLMEIFIYTQYFKVIYRSGLQIIWEIAP